MIGRLASDVLGLRWSLAHQMERLIGETYLDIC